MKDNVAAAGRYDRVAMLLHWLIAALIVSVAILGLLFEAIPRANRPFWINIHATVGLVMFGLILMRVLWRLSHPVPPPDVSWNRLVVMSSHLTHMALYGLMLLVPVIGIVAYVWHGRAFNFGPFQLDFGVSSQRGVYGPAENAHEFLGYALMAAVGLHVLGALWHHFIARDHIFSRILPNRSGGLEKP